MDRTWGEEGGGLSSQSLGTEDLCALLRGADCLGCTGEPVKAL